MHYNRPMSLAIRLGCTGLVLGYGSRQAACMRAIGSVIGRCGVWYELYVDIILSL